jgi:hypothetical protein
MRLSCWSKHVDARQSEGLRLSQLLMMLSGSESADSRASIT